MSTVAVADLIEASQTPATLLATARAHIEFSQYTQATTLYRKLITEQLLEDDPHALAEALANLGALLLHTAQLGPSEVSNADLEEAIALLRQAKALRSGDESAATGVLATNLALALYRRYESGGNSGDLMSAHLSLDGAKLIFMTARDDAALDWLGKVRELLVQAKDRRSARTPLYSF